MSEREKKERKIKHAIEKPWKKRERTSIQKIEKKTYKLQQCELYSIL